MATQLFESLQTRGGPLPVGLPRPGTGVYLVKENGDNPPSGPCGEVIVAGPDVSPGYLHAPELGSRAFFDAPNGRAYRTGDWGKVRDGLLRFEGRPDGQIKLHGYRIELADIEPKLRALAAVHDCAAVPVVRQKTDRHPLAELAANGNRASDP